MRIQLHADPVQVGFVTVFTLASVAIKWQVQFHFDILFFLLGIGVGYFLRQVAEQYFADLPWSPFHSIVGELIFVVLSLFVISSTRSVTGTGVVLAYFLQLLWEQAVEYQQSNTIASWFTGTELGKSLLVQRMVFFGGVGLFLLEAYVFLTI